MLECCFLLGQIFHALHFGRNNRLRDSLELRLFGRNDLLEFLFSRRYFRFLLLLQLGYFGLQFLFRICLELGLLLFHFLLVLKFKFGDDTFVIQCRLGLLLGQHLRKFSDQLFRFLLAFRLDFL